MRKIPSVSYLILSIIMMMTTSSAAQYLDTYDQYEWQQKDSIISTLFLGRAYSVVGLMIEDTYQKEKEKSTINPAAMAAFSGWQGIRYLVEENTAEAEKYLTESLTYYDTQPDLRNARYRDVLLNLADIKWQQSDATATLDLIHLATTHMETDSTTIPGDYLSSVFQGLDIAIRSKDLSTADKYGRKGLTFAQKSFGNQSNEYFQALSNIGKIHLAKGEPRRASNLIMQAYSLAKQYLPLNDIRRAYFGVSSIDVQNRLGRSTTTQKLYDEVLGQFDQFSDLQEDPIYPQLLDDLGAFYEDLGQLDLAYENFNRANILYTLRLNHNDPIYIQSQANVGNILRLQQKYTEAESYYLDAINRSVVIYGEDNWTEGYLRDHLGTMYFAMEQYEKSLGQRMRSLEIIEHTLGPNDPEYAVSRLNIGLTHLKLGHDSIAEFNLQMAETKLGLVYGTNHIRVYSANMQLASFYNQLEPTKSLEYLNRAREFVIYYHRHILNLLGYEDRLQMIQLFEQFIGQYASTVINLQEQTPTVIEDFHNMLLTLKGLQEVPDVATLAALANRPTQTFRKNYNLWQNLKNRIVTGQELTISGRKEANIDLAAFQTEIQGIKQSLIPSFGQIALKTVLNDQVVTGVKAALKSSDAMIDFVGLRAYNPTTHLFEPLTYFAFIDKANGPTRMIRLALNQNVLETSQSQNSAAFYPQLWQPLESHLSGVTRIYVSLDKALNKVSIQALPTVDGGLVYDQYEIVTVGNLKDILNIRPSQLGAKILLVGGPDLNILDTSNTEDMRLRVDPRMIYPNYIRTRQPLQSPSGTASEATQLAAMLTKKKKQVHLLKNATASKTNLKQDLKNLKPSLVHLAVPGFFTEPTAVVDTNTNLRFFTSASIKTGLVLSGAQKVWMADTIADNIQDDGLLTGLEISTLDLSNVGLVVCSAPRASGRNSNGASIHLLQRALKYAGAQNVLFSQWEVPQREKLIFFNLLYKNLLKGRSTSEALKKTQKKMRKKYDARHWAGFVLIQ